MYLAIAGMCVLDVKGAGSLVTTPPAIGGVLTSCGETRLTCSHNNIDRENTRWRIGTAMDSSSVCEDTINHLNPTRVPPYSCNQFMFENITSLPEAVSALSSTAVVNPLPMDLSGSQMQCIGGPVSASPLVGSVTLCVVGKVKNNKIESKVGAAVIKVPKEEWYSDVKVILGDIPMYITFMET